MKRTVPIMLQLILLVSFAEIGNGIQAWLGLVIPGSLIGMALLFFTLKLHIVRLPWVEQGANFLLAELLLFFVPSATGIVQYGPLFDHDGWKIVTVIGVSTILVMTITGLIVDFGMRRKGVPE